MKLPKIPKIADVKERFGEKSTKAGIGQIILGLGAVTHFNEAADVAALVTQGVEATATGGWLAGLFAVVTGIFSILYKKK